MWKLVYNLKSVIFLPQGGVMPVFWIGAWVRACAGALHSHHGQELLDYSAQHHCSYSTGAVWPSEPQTLSWPKKVLV